MSSTLQYSFVQSQPVIEKLLKSRQPSLQLPQRPLQGTSGVSTFEYLDSSLALLSGVLQTQDETLSREFARQERAIFDRFRHGFEDQAQRDVDLKERIETVDRAVSNGFQELERRLGQRIKTLEERFDTLMRQVRKQEVRDVRERNAHKFRLHHSVEPVPRINEEGACQLPDEAMFPRSVRLFWRLQQRDQSTLCVLRGCLMLIMS